MPVKIRYYGIRSYQYIITDPDFLGRTDRSAAESAFIAYDNPGPFIMGGENTLSVYPDQV